eukprot:9271386-Pyramimonas_sp.AAC.1
MKCASICPPNGGRLRRRPKSRRQTYKMTSGTFWLRSEEGEEGPRGAAAAGCTDKDAAYLGALSFNIDTGLSLIHI